MNRYNFYNSDLDAFELYHLEAQDTGDIPKATSKPADQSNALIAGVSGAIGTSIASVAVYPIDLIVKRLQVQRQIRATAAGPNAIDEDELYADFVDAAKRIYKEEGGLTAFYSGCVQDAANSMGNAFIYFLTYNYMRTKRLQAQTSSSGRVPNTLGVVEELSVGMIAGAISKFITAPVSNIVTRKQTASLRSRANKELSGEKAAALGELLGVKRTVPDVRVIVQDIYNTKGIQGFWAGYDATLILTMNPAITFFLYETLKALLPRRYRDKPTSGQTFMMGAVAKSVASAIMYPISLAKARSQVQQREDSAGNLGLWNVLQSIYRTQGIAGMYEGVAGEVLKGFFSNGIAMLIKEILHRQILSLYFAINRILNRKKPLKETVAEVAQDAYNGSTTESQRNTINNLASASQEKIAAAKNAVEASATFVKENTLNSISQAKDSVQSTASSALNTAQNTAVNAKDSIQSSASSALETAQNALSGAKDTIQSNVSSALQTTQSTVAGAKDSVQSTTSSAIGSTQNALDVAKSKIGTVQSQVSDTLSSGKESVQNTAVNTKDQVQAGLQQTSLKTQSTLSDAKSSVAEMTNSARKGLAQIIDPDTNSKDIGDLSAKIAGVEWSDTAAQAPVPKKTQDVGDSIAGIEWSDKK